MTNNEIKRYHGMLQASVIELDSAMRQRDGIVIEQSADSLDQLLFAQDREFEVRRLEAESFRLRQARAALHRIRTGTYGICQECDEPINPKRLRAMPAAALCIRCQEAEDGRSGAPHVQPLFAMAA